MLNKTTLIAVSTAVFGLGGGVMAADGAAGEPAVTAEPAVHDELVSDDGAYVRFQHNGDDFFVCDTRADGNGVYVLWETSTGASGRHGHSTDDTCREVTSWDFPETAVVSIRACVDVDNGSDYCSTKESRRADGRAP